ncbi:hypothetical protein R1flu_021526 [Riccia fluitans]|uniref:Uncharacterized protein n=1 Tax=Riccia fluitans TaxID=41844 RepID=A0ABD1ZPM1_9MARC
MYTQAACTHIPAQDFGRREFEDCSEEGAVRGEKKNQVSALKGNLSAGRIEEQREKMKDDETDYEKPIVQVEGIERGREKGIGYTGFVTKKEKEPERHFHEGDTIKTSYTVEEDAPSLYERIKGKFLAADYQVRTMVTDYTKKGHAHHERALPVSATKAEDEVKGKNGKEGPTGSGNADDETSDGSESLSSSKGAFSSETTEDKKVQAGEEMGTGYEESSEEGGPSPPSSVTGDTGSHRAQSESLFKPINPKDASDATVEEVQGSSLNQNASADDVKAPGFFTRIKEKVDALTDKVDEELGLKRK